MKDVRKSLQIGIHGIQNAGEDDRSKYGMTILLRLQVKPSRVGRNRRDWWLIEEDFSDTVISN